MSATLLQDAIVTVTALAAAWIVVRRVIGFATAERSPKCANCASASCAPASPSAGSVGRPTAHPLVVIRSSRH